MDLSTIAGCTFLGAALFMLSAVVILGGYRVAGAVTFWSTHLLVVVWALNDGRPLSALAGLLFGWALAAVVLGVSRSAATADARPEFPPTPPGQPLPPPSPPALRLVRDGDQTWRGTGALVKR